MSLSVSDESILFWGAELSPSTQPLETDDPNPSQARESCYRAGGAYSDVFHRAPRWRDLRPHVKEARKPDGRYRS